MSEPAPACASCARLFQLALERAAALEERTRERDEFKAASELAQGVADRQAGDLGIVHRRAAAAEAEVARLRHFLTDAVRGWLSTDEDMHGSCGGACYHWRRLEALAAALATPPNAAAPAAPEEAERHG